MANVELPTSGFGLSWVLAEGRGLITKSLAPSFVFVDYETFINTNIEQRLDKRGIDAYVSISAPIGLLTSLYGWDKALDMVAHGDNDPACRRAIDYGIHSIEQAIEAGASAVVLCDDLCGVHVPLVDPRMVVDHFLPLYERFAAKARELDTPLIFHSDGDIRTYYEILSSDGFSGVHVAHPDFKQTEELFSTARACGLRPLGGLVSARCADAETEHLAQFAAHLLVGGPALICDDGAAATTQQLGSLVAALARTRELIG